MEIERRCSKRTTRGNERTEEAVRLAFHAANELPVLRILICSFMNRNGIGGDYYDFDVAPDALTVGSAMRRAWNKRRHDGGDCQEPLYRVCTLPNLLEILEK